MSHAFLILTTRPPERFDDPSERSAILAARREEALQQRAGGELPTVPDHRAYLGWVDRLGRTHFWPGLLRDRRAR